MYGTPKLEYLTLYDCRTFFIFCEERFFLLAAEAANAAILASSAFRFMFSSTSFNFFDRSVVASTGVGRELQELILYMSQYSTVCSISLQTWLMLTWISILPPLFPVFANSVKI